MASGIEKVIVEIVGKADSAINAFKGAGDAADKFGKDSEKAHTALSKVSDLLKGAVVAGAAAAAYGLLDAAKAAAAEEQEMAVLKNTLEQAAGANDAIVASTESWITAQQNATGISDGKLRPALANLVAATKSIGTAQGLMATAMDISVAKGLDLETVTTAMAKAYNGNTGALGRLGIATKDAEGKALSFEQIMATCNQTFGGAAATAADTTAGKMAILGAQFADIKETVGTALLPVLTTLGGWLSQAVTWFGSLSPTMQAAIPIVAAVGLALGALVITVAPLITALPALGIAFAAISGPIGIAIAAVAALIAVGVLVYKNWDEIKAFAKSTWTAIKDTLSTVWNAIKDKFTEVWDAISSYATATWDAIKAEAERIWNAIKSVTEEIWNGIKEFFLTWWDGVKGLFTGEFGRMETLNETMWNAIKSAAVAIWNALKSALSGVWDEIKSAFQGLWDGCKEKWNTAAEWIGAIPGKIKGFFSGAASWLTDIGRSIMDGLLSGIKSAWNSVANFLSGLGAKIKALKGPIEEDRKLLIPEGKAIMESLGIGMDQGWDAIEQKLSKYGKDIKAWGFSLQNVRDVVSGLTGVEQNKSPWGFALDAVDGEWFSVTNRLSRFADDLADFGYTVGDALDYITKHTSIQPVLGFSGTGGLDSGFGAGGQSAWEAALAADNMAKYGNPFGRYYGTQFWRDPKKPTQAERWSTEGTGSMPADVKSNEGGRSSSAGSRVININVQGMGQMDTVRAIAGALATV